MFLTLSYFIACIVMGLGIAADVAMATLAMSAVITRSTAQIWVKRITATHVIFPMIGYYGFVALARTAQEFMFLLGIAASAFIGWFLFELVKEWCSNEDDDSGDSLSTQWYGWPLVLAVSYDALYSGPAKSAQAVNWNNFEVFVSFFVAGFVVLIVAITTSVFALKIADAIRNGTHKPRIWTTPLLQFVEFSILLYFCLLSIDRYVLSGYASSIQIMIVAIVLTAGLFIVIRKCLLSQYENTTN